MIPKTSDNRVLFAVPWHGKTLLGTTDTPIEKIELEPRALESEIEFILSTAKDYLTESPRRTDVLSVFAGIRPLIKTGETKNTASLARDHTIEIDDARLLTIPGGKWTTYRTMAEDAVNHAIKNRRFAAKKSGTENLKLHGAIENAERFDELAITAPTPERLQKSPTKTRIYPTNCTRICRIEQRR
jgi:glycerol-3-phosphate dehydrogenase